MTSGAVTLEPISMTEDILDVETGWVKDEDKRNSIVLLLLARVRRV